MKLVFFCCSLKLLPTVEINTERTNSSYLDPRCKLPKNLSASTDLRAVVQGSSVLIVAVPHEFLGRAMELKGEPLLDRGFAMMSSRGAARMPMGSM